jgi:Tfp pilus assembly protein PilN
MPVPPTVPTSFVPQSSIQQRRVPLEVGGVLAIVGYGLLLVALLVALGIFGYNWFLNNQEANLRKQLHDAEAGIDSNTVEEFVQLNQRLTEGKRLLAGHRTVSGIFDLFERIIPTTVQFTTFTVTLNEKTGQSSLSATGKATNFNAIAAFSRILGKETRLHNSILLHKTFDQKTGTVEFTLSVDLDESLARLVASAEVTPTPNP